MTLDETFGPIPARRGFGSWPGVDRSILSSRELAYRLVFPSGGESV